MLQSKHPEPKTSPESALLMSEDLPAADVIEITGSHIQSVARSIQGGAGPGCCDTTHWQDAPLWFRVHSDRLWNSVAALACRLLNTIVPWKDIRSLMANHSASMNSFVSPLICRDGRKLYL